MVADKCWLKTAGAVGEVEQELGNEDAYLSKKEKKKSCPSLNYTVLREYDLNFNI